MNREKFCVSRSHVLAYRCGVHHESNNQWGAAGGDNVSPRIQWTRVVEIEQLQEIIPAMGQQHPLQWVVEPLMDEPSYLQRAMFGCLGCYLHGRLKVVLAARREPWRGLLIPTAREHHAALLQEEVALCVHPVLSKWLYLAESSDAFEEAAQRLVEWIQTDDPRIGVEPGQKGRTQGAGRKPRARARHPK
jgi:hypothetical protein